MRHQQDKTPPQRTILCHKRTIQEDSVIWYYSVATVLQQALWIISDKLTKRSFTKAAKKAYLQYGHEPTPPCFSDRCRKPLRGKKKVIVQRYIILKWVLCIVDLPEHNCLKESSWTLGVWSQWSSPVVCTLVLMCFEWRLITNGWEDDRIRGKRMSIWMLVLF